MKCSFLGVGLVAGAALFALASGRAAEVDGNLSKTFTVSPGGKLVIEADRGSIEVRPGADDKVEVQITRKVTGRDAPKADQVLAAHTVTFSQDGNQVTVRARYDRGALDWVRRSPNLHVRYQVTVPNKFSVDLQTAGGGIDVGDLIGGAHARTAGGSIKIGKIDGQVWANTAGGNVSVAGTSGPIEARTSGGSIQIEDAGGAVVAGTSGGSIKIKNASGRVRAETAGGSIEAMGLQAGFVASTSGGNITASLTRGPEEDCTLQTTGGSIHLGLPERVSAGLEAHAVGGRITCALPVTVQGEHKRDRLEGKLGDGGKLLKLHTVGGNIDVR